MGPFHYRSCFDAHLDPSIIELVCNIPLHSMVASASGGNNHARTSNAIIIKLAPSSNIPECRIRTSNNKDIDESCKLDSDKITTIDGTSLHKSTRQGKWVNRLNIQGYICFTPALTQMLMSVKYY